MTGRPRSPAALSRLHPVDRSLLLFMAVLLGQSAYSLFFPASASAAWDSIDIIVRTASASIFGYFLSVGFAAGPTPDGPAAGGGHTLEPAAHPSACRPQIAAATGIGLFCLLTLIALRNWCPWDPALIRSESVSATVVQFRDFVSGSVGFLIGCPTQRSGPTPP